jgi:hypothetical protein
MTGFATYGHAARSAVGIRSTSASQANDCSASFATGSPVWDQLRGYFSFLLVPEDGLHPSLQGIRQRSASFGIVEIPNIPKVPKVKWNIVLTLRD